MSKQRVDFGLEEFRPEHNHDDEIHAVASLFSSELVTERVRLFLSQQAEDELSHALAANLTTELSVAVHAEASHELRSDAIGREAELARFELARGWMNLVLHAWDLWGEEHGTVRLSHEDASPVAPSSLSAEDRLAWTEDNAWVTSGLLANIALSGDDVAAIRHQFAERLRHEHSVSKFTCRPHGKGVELAFASEESRRGGRESGRTTSTSSS